MDNGLKKVSESVTVEQLVNAVKSVDKRVVTAIKVERWISAINEFHNADFRCTIEELAALSAANNDNFGELSPEEKEMQRVMNEKIELVQFIVQRIPRMFGHILPVRK